MNTIELKRRIEAGKPRQKPVWFTKKCRAYLKSVGLDPRDLAGCVVHRALRHFEKSAPEEFNNVCLPGLIDHDGMIKNGDDWNYYLQPYNHTLEAMELLKRFCAVTGMSLIEDGSTPGPHHPETIYIEIGQAG